VAIRGQDWTLPVFLVTGETSSTVRSEAMRLGAQALFAKPLDLDRIAREALSTEPPVEVLDWCA
jgi:hypothetical protein